MDVPVDGLTTKASSSENTPHVALFLAPRGADSSRSALATGATGGKVWVCVGTANVFTGNAFYRDRLTPGTSRGARHATQLSALAARRGAHVWQLHCGVRGGFASGRNQRNLLGTFATCGHGLARKYARHASGHASAYALPIRAPSTCAFYMHAPGIFGGAKSGESSAVNLRLALRTRRVS